MSRSVTMQRILLTMFAALLLAPALAFAQADYAREKRWAEEITPAIVIGDPL
jgi:hypothetical protein